MNNYELHDQAQAMADSMSGYELAKALIEEREDVRRYERDWLGACDTADRLEKERNALAAHVERVKEWWGDDRKRRLSLPEIREIIESSPTTSLARRDAEVAAHTAQQIQWNVAADCIGHETLKPSVVLGWLSDYAVTYRRQAEEQFND